MQGTLKIIDNWSIDPCRESSFRLTTSTKPSQTCQSSSIIAIFILIFSHLSGHQISNGHIHYHNAALTVNLKVCHPWMHAQRHPAMGETNKDFIKEGFYLIILRWLLWTPWLTSSQAPSFPRLSCDGDDLVVMQTLINTIYIYRMNNIHPTAKYLNNVQFIKMCSTHDQSMDKRRFCQPWLHTGKYHQS